MEPLRDQPSPRLEVTDLVKTYAGRKVVDGVSLTIAPGQVTCLLGPSGCGKSTTLRMIAGIEKQDSGSIWSDGRLLCDGLVRLPPEERGVGLMFQDFALFPHLTVAQNVAYGLPRRAPETQTRVKELLTRVDMLKHIDAYPHELSGGEQQRIALARAIAPRPKVMLMDEPFSGLDDRLRDEIRDQTLDVLKAEGTAVLLVTHEPAEAMRMADEIALMRAGRIVQRGAPYTIYNSPADKEAAAFFSDINVVEGVVEGALAQTAFGAFLTPGLPDGTPVDIVVRPQHLKLELDRNGKGPNPTLAEGTAVKGFVQRARFMGVDSLVEFELENGTRMTARVPSVFLPKKGRLLWLLIRRDRCYVFPRLPG